jgi:hypothetical protein
VEADVIGDGQHRSRFPSIQLIKDVTDEGCAVDALALLSKLHVEGGAFPLSKNTMKSILDL